MTTDNVTIPFREALSGELALERLQSDVQNLIAHLDKASAGNPEQGLTSADHIAFRAETIVGNLLVQFDSYMVTDWDDRTFGITELPDSAWQCVIRIVDAGTVVQARFAVNTDDADPDVQIIVDELTAMDTDTDTEAVTIVKEFIVAADHHATAKLAELILSA